MLQAYIVDIDGTVADLAHRLHCIRNGVRDHAGFEAGIPDDAPIWPVIRIVQALYSYGFVILFTSGRAERTRAATEAWLRSFDIPFHDLYMRADGDMRADHVVKRQILDGIRADGYEIVGVIDDRQSVVDMWREEGLTCLQAAPTSFDFATPEGIRPTLTMMVGPSGAGKSSWLASPRALNEYGIHPQHVIASDQIRLDLYCTIHCMDKGDDVFDALRSVVKARLKAGLPVCVDSTNIRDKDRRATAELAGGICPVRYIVIDRPLADKLATGGWRLDVTFKDGSNLIKRHDQVFRSNIKNIMAGDGLANVDVFDERTLEPARLAAA